MQFQLLGPLQVLRDAAPLALGQPKQRAVLGLLLLRRGRFVSRDELIEAIWGDAPPRSAIGSVHVYVHGLRRVLDPDRIEGLGTAYRIRLEPGELDLERFEALVEQARSALAGGGAERAATSVRAALDLWRGPAFAALPPDLLAAERAHLDELRLSARELQIDADLECGENGRAIARLSTLIAEHPFRERLREQQLLALYRSGRQQEALEAYRRARDVLVEELGIEPGPRLRGLEAAILRQDAELVASPRGWPEVASASTARAAVPLPAAPGRLIGRSLEVAEIEALFSAHDARLATLTGPGGTGKTRLALAVAERLAPRLPDGARFIDLSLTPDPDLLLAMIAGELDVPVGRSPREALAEQLRPLRMLLVLDNLEHLLSAATALSDLLAAAPALLMLVTSRAPLRLRAEHVYPVPPLAPPQPGASFDEIVGSTAVELLHERTRAVNRACALTESSAPAFADICRRLDGLPLALELAASRMRTLAPEAVAAGLSRALDLLVEGPRDLPARHHTLRATLDWSYQQLGAAQQLLFAQLAAFAGGFDADDVAAVCGAQSAGPLASLVEINLVRQPEPGCFTMLQTIREYAAEWLERSGENAAVRTRHCRHVLEVTERAHEAILAADEAAAAYTALERVHDNLREALGWAAQAGEVELEVRLACAARQFWLVRGHLAEGRAFFERAVLATEGADPRLRAQALMHGGPFLYRQGELDLARTWWEEALGLLEEQRDVAGVSRCAGELGAVAFSEGDLENSARWYERAANGFAALGDRMRLGIVRANQAEIAALQGDLSSAAANAEEAVVIAREAGDLDSLALGLHTLGRLALNAGETGRARELIGEALIAARDIGYREAVANCVQAAAEITLVQDGDPELAARLQAIASHTLEQMGMRLQGLEAESFARTERSLTARLGDERLGAITNETSGESLESVVEAALGLLGPHGVGDPRAALG